MRLSTFKEKKTGFFRLKLVTLKGVDNDLLNLEEGQDLFPLRGKRVKIPSNKIQSRSTAGNLSVIA